MPELLRAYGDLLRSDGARVFAVLRIAVIGVTALVVLFALGALAGRLARLLGRVRDASRGPPS